MLKEDTINVFVNIGNDVKLKNKVATDEEGFACRLRRPGRSGR